MPNRPMSSPRLTTSCGRLQENIHFSLSAKGVVLEHFLKSIIGGELEQIAKMTLAKLDLITTQ